jgi:CheY-like chemotaxis protein
MAQRVTLKSTLLVDDDEDALELYAHLLKQKLKTHVVKTKYPGIALRLASEQFFDMILIDVTMDYKGTPFGGLELYKSLLGRYGSSSLIAYSQLVNDDLLKQYEYDFNFIERGTNPLKFIDGIVAAMQSFRKAQSCFIAMPFDKNYGRLFRTLRECIEAANFQCVRVDQQSFNKSIVEKIFTEIHNAKLVAFLATDQNPNAFYECGFAVALNKEVITLTDFYKNMPFDIRDRNAIAYGKDLGKLKREFLAKLLNLTHVVSP